jgi:hypothetical protein
MPVTAMPATFSLLRADLATPALSRCARTVLPLSSLIKRAPSRLGERSQLNGGPRRSQQQLRPRTFRAADAPFYAVYTPTDPYVVSPVDEVERKAPGVSLRPRAGRPPDIALLSDPATPMGAGAHARPARTVGSSCLNRRAPFAWRPAPFACGSGPRFFPIRSVIHAICESGAVAPY